MHEKRRRSCERNKFLATLFDTEPSVYHAVVIIFLEYFAWGLLTSPVIDVLHETFPQNAFLMNGLIAGLKGLLSFLCAPLVGALSDTFGRKPFLLLTVTFTCAPIPLMRVNAYWYFSVLTISGVLSVTFSIVFAYVADVTTERDRSRAYGYVSATFAASLVVSPALGAVLQRAYSEHFVILVATCIAFADVLFILLCVPESLEQDGSDTPSVKRKAALERERERKSGTRIEPQLIRLDEPRREPRQLQVQGGRGSGASGGGGGSVSLRQSVVDRIATVNWDSVDPFAALRKVSSDQLFLMLCLTTLLSYLPEAGEYSAIFVYLRLVIGFSEAQTAYFIGFVGVLSVIAQSVFLEYLMRTAGAKKTIFVGLLFEFFQLCWYAFTSSFASMWIAGGFAALGSVTYPAISAFVSAHASSDEQGVAQGVITGIRGLCSGLGPATFGFIFYLFQIDLSVDSTTGSGTGTSGGQAIALAGRGGHSRAQSNVTMRSLLRPEEEQRLLEVERTKMGSEILSESIMPGPPFAFGAALVLLALLVSTLIPDDPHMVISISQRKNNGEKEKETTLEGNEEAGAGAGRDSERRGEAAIVNEQRAVGSETAVLNSSMGSQSGKFGLSASASTSTLTLASTSSQHQLQHQHQHQHGGSGTSVQLFGASTSSRTTRSNSGVGYSMVPVMGSGTAGDYTILGQIDSDD